MKNIIVFIICMFFINVLCSSLSKQNKQECILGIKPNRLNKLIKNNAELLNIGNSADYITSTLISLPCPENFDEINESDDVQFIAKNTKLRAS